MNAVLEMRGIDKRFPGVHALRSVDLTVRAGEVHALIGENGAGKSTLMKILSGVYHKDAGEIRVAGQSVEMQRPEDANRAGISTIYQELNLMPNLSIAENIFIGREKRRGLFWDRARTLREAERYVREVGLQLDVKTPVGALTIAQRQMVEVAKALSMEAKVIVMDEPSSSLAEHETAILLDIVRKLRASGTAIIFISHRLNEVFAISDRITVLRDGECVGSVAARDCSEEELIRMMVGRPLTELYPKVSVPIGEEVLRAEHIVSGSMVRDVSFSLRKGEILGLAGLVGAGRSELMGAIFGTRPMDSGTVSIEGQRFTGRWPAEAIAMGLGLVPEDRKQQGLVLSLSLRENVSLSSLESVGRAGFISRRSERELSEDYVAKLGIRTPGIEQKVGRLSGGNQQKVVVAKCLATGPKVLILDEPTRGIDVGAKKEIYSLMCRLAAQGVGIIMISSELPEVLGMSDRILVMHEGELRGELSRAEASQERIMSMILREGERAGEVKS